jgi:hypothetical protein
MMRDISRYNSILSILLLFKQAFDAKIMQRLLAYLIEKHIFSNSLKILIAYGYEALLFYRTHCFE